MRKLINLGGESSGLIDKVRYLPLFSYPSVIQYREDLQGFLTDQQPSANQDLRSYISTACGIKKKRSWYHFLI